MKGLAATIGGVSRRQDQVDSGGRYPLQQEFHLMTLLALPVDWPGRDDESLAWLASYPRSGNTFTRILLANYFAAGGTAYELNKLQDFIPSDISTALWPKVSDTAFEPENYEALWKARPAAIARYRKTKGPQTFPCLKTHTANVSAFGSSGFDFRQNDRVIYLVRHPLDVLLSYADFNATDIDFTIGQITTSGFTVTQPVTGSIEIRGSWSENVSGWIVAPPCPVLLVRYEELSTETERILRSILAFLGIPIIEERLRYAVSTSRFDKLREQEMAQGFHERPADALSGRFFREGKALQWLRKLTPEQANRLADACEEEMTMLGYTHPRDVLFDGRNAVGRLNLPGQNLKPDSTSSL